MLLLKEMINSIFGTNPILFLLLQSLLTGLPLLPSMSQIILLKWGRELGASLQTFQVFHVFFFIFSSDFLKLDIEMPPGRSAKFIISVSQRLPMVSSIESIDLLLPRSSGQMLNCNGTHQILGVYSPAQNTIQLFGIQKLFLSQYFLHCLSERLQFSDERFCLTRKYLLSPAAPFILDANVFQSQYCYNISHLSTSPQDNYTKVGNTAYNN